jgi:NADH-quinone oxidoreductase subunit C
MTGPTTSGAGVDEAAAPAPEVLHGAPVTDSRGQRVAHPSRTEYVTLITALKADGFAMCADLCAVDYLGNDTRELPVGVAPERFEVVVNLLSLASRERIRVRVQVPETDCTLASLYELYSGTEAMEREAYDLMGIEFTGHPDLTRILMPDDWEGHPLRKDYAMGRIPVQFKAPAAAAAVKHGTPQGA